VAPILRIPILRAIRLYYLALLNKHTAAAQYLLAQGASVATRNLRNDTTLIVAAGLGKTELLPQLLKHGANIKDVNIGGIDPIRAALYNKHLSAVQLLINATKISFNIKAHFDKPSLSAAVSGSIELLLWTLSLGGDINERNAQGDTPLIMAIYNKHLSIAEWLIKHGANVNVANDYGSTPFEFAVSMDLTLLIIITGVNKFNIIC
jgi:ankyrin repeat protein